MLQGAGEWLARPGRWDRAAALGLTLPHGRPQSSWANGRSGPTREQVTAAARVAKSEHRVDLPRDSAH